MMLEHRSLLATLIAFALGGCGAQEPWDARGTWAIVLEQSGASQDGGPVEFNTLWKDGRLVVSADGTATWTWPELDKTLYQPGEDPVRDQFLHGRTGSVPTKEQPTRHPWQPAPDGFVIRVQDKPRLYRRLADDVVEWSETTTTEWKGKPTTVRLLERWQRAR